LNIRSLAEFVAETGTGIEPWQPRYELTHEEYKRINEAEERLARGGDWARTILVLLDESNASEGQAHLPGATRTMSARDASDIRQERTNQSSVAPLSPRQQVSVGPDASR
jgi:hypothetical protein